MVEHQVVMVVLVLQVFLEVEEVVKLLVDQLVQDLYLVVNLEDYLMVVTHQEVVQEELDIMAAVEEEADQMVVVMTQMVVEVQVI